MERFKAIFLLLILLLPAISLAQPYYGLRLDYVLAAKEPDNLSGYQAMLTYDPQTLQWRRFNIYFDGGFSSFSVPEGPNSHLNIYSIAPVIRYTFKKQLGVAPYIELGIGLAYLNHTRIADRNLGIHFAFQDRMGVGAAFGRDKQISIGINAIHYSNGHLASHNSGITMPIVLDVGYHFL